MCSDSSESRKTDALECMWLLPRKVMRLNVWYIHAGGEQIQESETHNFRDRGPRIGFNGGWAGGQAGQHKLSSLGQGPTMSPGGQGRAVIIIDAGLLRAALTCLLCAALKSPIRALHARAVLDCWRQGIAYGNGRLFDSCFRVFACCAKKKIFCSFTLFSQWKWFIFRLSDDVGHKETVFLYLVQHWWLQLDRIGTTSPSTFMLHRQKIKRNWRLNLKLKKKEEAASWAYTIQARHWEHCLKAVLYKRFFIPLEVFFAGYYTK